MRPPRWKRSIRHSHSRQVVVRIRLWAFCDHEFGRCPALCVNMDTRRDPNRPPVQWNKRKLRSVLHWWLNSLQMLVQLSTDFRFQLSNCTVSNSVFCMDSVHWCCWGKGISDCRGAAMFWGKPLLCLCGADEFDVVVGFRCNFLASWPLELRTKQSRSCCTSKCWLEKQTSTCLMQTHFFSCRISHFVFDSLRFPCHQKNDYPASSLKLQVAVTHDPNKKEDRPILKRGEYMAGASIVAGRM